MQCRKPVKEPNYSALHWFTIDRTDPTDGRNGPLAPDRPTGCAKTARREDNPNQSPSDSNGTHQVNESASQANTEPGSFHRSPRFCARSNLPESGKTNLARYHR